jgi:hypothetical protein
MLRICTYAFFAIFFVAVFTFVAARFAAPLTFLTPPYTLSRSIEGRISQFGVPAAFAPRRTRPAAFFAMPFAFRARMPPPFRFAIRSLRARVRRSP